IEILYTETNLINQTAYTQPALFAIEYALAQMWQSWGIKPDIVIGHSVGEYVAACLAGIFSLEDGLKLIAYRGKLMQQLPTGGEMVAIIATAAQIQPIIAPYKQQVSIAAYNTPNSIVISGEKAAIREICNQLEQQNIKTKYLKVSHAFHSPLMSPMLAEFEKIAQQITYNQPKIPLISNLTGQKADATITTPKYWVSHISQPVKFADSINTLIELGYEVFLEIGPKPTLLGMGRQCLEDNIGTWLPSLRPGIEEWQQILQSLGQLYIQGAEIDWLGFDADYQRKKIQLPTYPFQRQRYWLETNHYTHPSSNLVKQQRKSHQHPLLGEQLRLPFTSQIRFENQLATNNPPHQEHHRIFNINILAAASHIALTLLAVKQGFGTSSCTIEQVFFQKPLVIAEKNNRTIQIIIETENKTQNNFQIISQETGTKNQDTSWVKHVTGLLKIEQELDHKIISHQEIENIQKRCSKIIKGEEYYQQLTAAGYTLGTAFQWIDKAWQGNGEALGKMQLPEIPDTVNDYQLYPGLIDSCFQVLGMCQGLVNELDHIDTNNFIFIPFHIEKFQFCQQPKSSNLWCHVQQINQDKPGSLIGDILIFDNQGEIIAKITNFEARKASREVLRRSLQPNLNDWYYQLEWQVSQEGDSRKKEREKSSTLSPSFLLIFAHSNNVGAEITHKLEKQGYQSIVVYPGENYQKLDNYHYQVSPTQPADFHKLLSAIFEETSVQGIVHLWSLETTIDKLTNAQEMTCGSVLHLLQAMLSNFTKISPQLLLATQGVHQINHDQESVQVQQAPLWGLGKV
ncbi:acyltransferase domain-containing protein, partial [Anabaena sp. UHCC 0253]|uniref:acyltransferase domain-containing protein n=1 Tax=Anabaena sp. UHCC 0253 TaxID=2590019 RepID=UPI001C2BB9EF